MAANLIKMQVEEIFHDYNNRDLIEDRISNLGFECYLYPKYKRKTRWPDDVQFMCKKDVKDNEWLLVIDWINCHYELYKLESEGDT